MKNNLVLGILILLLASCSSAKPTFIGVENWAFGALKDSVLTARMDYVIYNPNTTTYTLKSSEVGLYYKSTLLGRGSLQNKTVLRPKDTLKLPMHCTVLLEKLSKFQQALLQSDSISLQVKGVNKIGFLGSSIPLQVNETVRFSIKKLISETIMNEENPMDNLQIKGVSVNSLPSLNSTNFTLEIETRNTLPFDYTIEVLALNFHVDPHKKAVAQWNSKETIPVKQQENIKIPVEVSINNFSMAQQSKLSWLVGGKANLHVKGTVRMTIGNYVFDFPITKEVEANLNPFSN